MKSVIIFENYDRKHQNDAIIQKNCKTAKSIFKGHYVILGYSLKYITMNRNLL